jgi:CTP:molybdopterin cytidylyltransferase MocA
MMETARARHLGALRAFLTLLLEKGYRLHGVPVEKCIDVDHPEDIAKAEDYLRDHGEG